MSKPRLRTAPLGPRMTDRSNALLWALLGARLSCLHSAALSSVFGRLKFLLAERSLPSGMDRRTNRLTVPHMAKHRPITRGPTARPQARSACTVRIRLSPLALRLPIRHHPPCMRRRSPSRLICMGAHCAPCRPCLCTGFMARPSARSTVHYLAPELRSAWHRHR